LKIASRSTSPATVSSLMLLSMCAADPRPGPGLHLVAPEGRDDELLALARQFEAAAPQWRLPVL